MNNMNLFERLGSKSRDKKVMITDIAISKVPFIEYKNIDPSEYDIIQAINKLVLETSKNENDSNEVAIVYGLVNMNALNPDSDYLGVSLGDEHDVFPCKDTASSKLINGFMKCAVMLSHNHPSLSLISLDDIQFLLEYSSVQLVVVVSNLGAVSYISKSHNYNRREAIILLNECITKHNDAKTLQEMEDAVKYFISNCNRVGLDYDDR